MEKLQKWAGQQEDELLKFTARPVFEEAFDQDTGELYKVTNPKDGVSRVTSLNLNNNVITTPPTPSKDIWYQVTVAECKDGSDVVLVSDPRFENDGKN